MSLTVNIYYTGTGDNARRFAQEMLATGVVAEIRAKAGMPEGDKAFVRE